VVGDRQEVVQKQKKTAGNIRGATEREVAKEYYYGTMTEANWGIVRELSRTDSKDRNALPIESRDFTRAEQDFYQIKGASTFTRSTDGLVRF